MEPVSRPVVLKRELTKGRIFMSWEKICFREELGRKAVDENTLSFIISLFST